MESTCDHGKIQVSEATAKFLTQDSIREKRAVYKLIEKGEVKAKGKGLLTTWKLQLGQDLIKPVSLRSAVKVETKRVARQRSKRRTVLNIDRHRDDMQMVKDHVGDAHEKLVAADDLN